MSGKKSVYRQQREAEKKIKKTNKYLYLFVPLLLVLADYAAVLCAEEAAMQIRNLIVPYTANRVLNSSGGVFRVSWLVFYVITPFLYLLFMHLCELYTRNMQSWRVVESIFKANLYGFLSVIFILYIGKTAESTSRLYIALLGITGFLFLVFFRYILKRIFNQRNIGEPVLLMGAGTTAAVLLKHVAADVGMNYNFIGFLEDNTPHPDVAKELPWLGNFADAGKIIQNTGVQNVLVTAPGLTNEKIQDIVYELQPLVKSIGFIPDLGTLPLSTMDVESLVDGRVAMLHMRNNLKNRGNRLLKVGFDWCLTLVGTICISPVLLIIGIWIYRDSPGPIFFKHRRIGKDGKEFYCYKFRSMCVDADVKLKELLDRDPEARAEWDKDFKLKHDPRITKSGAFLRKTSLDELPQIFNVLKGEMSLVGPRPIIRDEIPRYGKFIKEYYMVRPGITGMWQTSGRSDIDYDERVQMDTWYVRNWNIWFDIVLLWRTFSVVLHKKGAY